MPSLDPWSLLPLSKLPIDSGKKQKNKFFIVMVQSAVLVL